LDFRMSGFKSEMSRRNHRNELRDVSTVRSCAPVASARCGGHHGGTSCSSATSQSQAASVDENSGSSDRGRSGTARPWKRFQVSTRTRRMIAA
jgi:hypothetical protein